MLKHNLLIAYRTFTRNKSSFSINILGLTTGLACAMLIFLWVLDEAKMDAFHEKGDRLYQVMQKVPMVDGVMVADWSPGPLADALLEEIPEVEHAISAKMAPEVLDGIISYNERFIKARPHFAGSTFFDLFSYPLIHGNKDQVLDAPYNIAISENLATSLFGTTVSAVGQTVRWEKKIGEIIDFTRDFTVTGVFDNEVKHSSDDFDVLFSFDFYLEKSPQTNEWFNDQATTYLTLREGVRAEALDEKITALVASNREANHDFFLKKYSSKYLYDKYDNGAEAGGRIEYVWLFSLIAILILVIASINFMNLSTAKASIRVKEIGTKKTLGATRSQLIVQFIQESILISLIAFLFALVAVYLFLPQFNAITGKQIVLTGDSRIWAPLLAISLFTGLCSSIYPALYLSGFNPIQVLKGKINISFGEVWVRKALVVFQFAISVVLIVFVLVIYQQVDFIHSKNLGYDRDNIISFQREGVLEQNMDNFLADIRTLPGVSYASYSSGKLIESSNFTWGIDWPGRAPEEALQINPFIVGYDFLETYNLNVISGRPFSTAFSNEETKVILNESAVESMGLENPVGTRITIWNEEVEIIGVVEDFHFQSLYSEIAPCFIKLFPKDNNYATEIAVKINAGSEKTTLDQMAQLYEVHNPGYPFQFSFMDEEYAAIYTSENRISVLSRLFAGLAITISCLGLFGLAAFTTERRTKEIGIRKILGASVWGIVGLLSKDFTKMIIAAICVALPVSFIVSSQWLQGFRYGIELKWWFFVGAALSHTPNRLVNRWYPDVQGLGG